MTAEGNSLQPRRVRSAGYSLTFNLGQRCLVQFDMQERLKPLAHFIARLEGAWAALDNSLGQGS